jgi:hypothetical protein
MEAATLNLQILTLIVAAIGPLLAYHYARKLAVSGNRQAWIDALREDVAHFIALKDNRITLLQDLAHSGDVERRSAMTSALTDRTVELQAARHRIKLRLRTGNARHDRLAAAIEAMAEADDQADRSALRAEIVEAAKEVITYTWEKVERGE